MHRNNQAPHLKLTSDATQVSGERSNMLTNLAGLHTFFRYPVKRQQFFCLLNSFGQMTLDRGVGHRGHARLGQDPQRVLLAGRLDQPGDHELAEDLICFNETH